MGYLDSLVHWYDLSTPVGNPDLGIPGGNPAVGANIVSNPPGVGGGICAEFNGNNSNYNCGDIVELNAVTAFTIAFWMNQDVLDVLGWMCSKRINSEFTVNIFTDAGGAMTIYVADGVATRANFDYSVVVNAGQWHHITVVFDGSQTGNANRLIAYVDATPVVLTFVGTIPAVTADLSGIDFLIGRTALAFDGKLDTFMFFNAALSNLAVTDLYLRSRRGML